MGSMVWWKLNRWFSAEFAFKSVHRIGRLHFGRGLGQSQSLKSDLNTSMTSLMYLSMLKRLVMV